MEGQTATNPQTGEKIVFRGGQWQPMNTPAAPQAPGVIMGRPKAPTQLQVSADNRDNVRLGIDQQEFIAKQDDRAREIAKDAADAEEKAAKRTNAQNSAKYNLAKVIGQITNIRKDAADNGGWFETGTSGAISRAVLPAGTAGFDLAENIKTVDANSAFSALQQMRDNSPTGGALGQVTEKELDLLKSSIANLNPDQSQEQFLANLKIAQNAYIDMLARVDPLEAYKVALENGATAQEITDIAVRNNGPVPDPAILQQAVDFTAGGGTGASFRPPEDTPPDNGGGGLGQALYAGVGDVAEGVGDVLGLVGNPLNAGINAIAGTNLSTDLGQTFRQATGAPEGDPLASAINRGGVSALTGAGLAGAARPIATGVGRAVTNALVQEPIRQGIAGGAAGASSELARQSGANPLLQAAAGLAGGVGAFGATGGVNALLQPRQASSLAQAAERQNVQLMPADVGGATTRRLTSAAAQAPLSSPPIVAAAERANSTFGAATQKAVQGSRLAPDDAGEIVRKAGERFTKDSRAKGGALYNRAEKMAQGVRIKAKGAVQTIDEQIAQLSEAGDVNAPLVNELTKFRNSLASNEGIRIGGMRDIRTGAQKAAYSEDLRSTPANRVFGIVADAISRDIDAGLSQAGREGAAKAFKTADAYWRARVQYIDKVLEPVIGGGKSGESVLQAVESMAQGKGKGVQTLIKLMRSVDKDEAADIQATIIDRLGKSRAGQQNADGTTYSAAEFLTNWNKMSGKGKAALFPDQQVRKNLDELAMIADNMKQAGRFANSSNTGGAIAGQVILSGGLGAVSLPAFLMGSGAQYLTGMLLASPKFTQWLAKVPANPQAQAAYVRRLDAIASAEPIIANDIASVKQFLANAPSSSRAAASQGQDVGEERPIPPQ